MKTMLMNAVVVAVMSLPALAQTTGRASAANCCTSNCCTAQCDDCSTSKGGGTRASCCDEDAKSAGGERPAPLHPRGTHGPY